METAYDCLNMFLFREPECKILEVIVMEQFDQTSKTIYICGLDADDIILDFVVSGFNLVGIYFTKYL